MSKYQNGPNSLAVPGTLFSDNRAKVNNALKTNSKINDTTFIFVKGGETLNFYNTDVEYLFRQEPFFFYLFGVTESDCAGVINVKNGRTLLFIPRLPEEYSVWMGPLKSCNDFKLRYEVDEVYYVDEIDKVLSRLSPSLLLTLSGYNTDSGLTLQPATFDGIEKYITNCDILYPVISECRVVKSDAEIDVLRYVAEVSAAAHCEVLKKFKPGMTEFQAESIFVHHCYFTGGCRHVSYPCICGVGGNSAILHYGHTNAPNDCVVEDGDMCLFDMGANYHGYAADITISFPVNGKFTEDQKFIYNAVLYAHKVVIDNAKAGVSWVDMHNLSNRALLEKLREGNLLVGDIDDMMEAGIAAIFQPHGLGHLLGIDVHDVGGYLENCPPRPTQPGANKLRTARVLQEGIVITIEPGCYFIETLLKKALENPNQSKFIIVETLNRFRKFGGIRIEDDVLITKDGCDILSANIPRTVEEIESFMAEHNK